MCHGSDTCDLPFVLNTFFVVSGGFASKRDLYLGFIRYKVGPLGIVFVTDGCVYVGSSGVVSFSINLLTCITSSIE